MTSSHPISDAELVRLMDGEGSPDEIDGVTAHVESCPECRDRLELLRRADAVVERALAGAAWDARDHDPWELPRADGATRTARTNSLRRVWLRAAVLSLVAGGLAMTLSPVRAFMASLWPGGQSPESAGLSPEGVIAVSYIPTEPSLSIRIRNGQRIGTLVIETTADNEVTARVSASQGHEEIVVLPGILEILNTMDSEASYEIFVPWTLERVSLELGAMLDTLLWAPVPAERTRYQTRLVR